MANKQISPTAKALQSARKALGLTLEKAASELSELAKGTEGSGISPSQLSRIETGAAYLSQERLEQLAEFYGLSVPDLHNGAVMKAPSRVDLARLKAVVSLVQQVVLELRVKPSAEKMADVVALVYERETEWTMAQPELKVDFNPDRHREFIQLTFKK